MGNVVPGKGTDGTAEGLCPAVTWLCHAETDDFDIFVHDCSEVHSILTDLSAEPDVVHQLTSRFAAHNPKLFISALVLCSQRLHDADKLHHLWTLHADCSLVSKAVFASVISVCCTAINILNSVTTTSIAPEPDFDDQSVGLDLAKWWVSTYPGAQQIMEAWRGTGCNPLGICARPALLISTPDTDDRTDRIEMVTGTLGLLEDVETDLDESRLRIRDLVEAGLVDGAWVDSLLRNSGCKLETEVSQKQYLRHMVPAPYQDVCGQQFGRVLAEKQHANRWFTECRHELSAETDDLSLVAKAHNHVLQSRLSPVLSVADQTQRAISDKEDEIRQLEYVRRNADNRIRDERDRLARLRATLVYVQRQVDEVHQNTDTIVSDVQHVYQRQVASSAGFRSTPGRKAARVHPRTSLSRSGPSRGRALLAAAERLAKRDHLQAVSAQSADSPASSTRGGRRHATAPGKESRDARRQLRVAVPNPGDHRSSSNRGQDPFKDFLKDGAEEDANLAVGQSEESKVEAFRRLGRFERRQLKRAMSETTPQKLFEDNKFYTPYGWSVERKRHDKVQLTELEQMKASVSQQDWHRAADTRVKFPSLRSLDDVRSMQKTIEYQHRQIGSVVGLPATRPERVEHRQQRDVANAAAGAVSKRPQLLLGDGVSNLRARMRLVKHHVLSEQAAVWDDSIPVPESIEDRKLAQKYDLALHRVLEFRRGFAKTDKDGSGFVDKDEFRYVLGKVCRGVEIREQQLESWWSAVDKNRNGKIEFEEFMVWLSNNPVFREQEFLQSVSRRVS